MILLNAYTHMLGKFNTYTQLTRFIMQIENEKLLEGHPHFGQSGWSFMVYSQERIGLLYNKASKRDSFFTETLNHAYHQGLEVLETCTGDFDNPRYTLIVPELDLEAAKKNWCRRYCQAQRYQLIDRGAVPILPQKRGEEIQPLPKPDLYIPNPYILYILMPLRFTKAGLGRLKRRWRPYPKKGGK